STSLAASSTSLAASSTSSSSSQGSGDGFAGENGDGGGVDEWRARCCDEAVEYVRAQDNTLDAHQPQTHTRIRARSCVCLCRIGCTHAVSADTARTGAPGARAVAGTPVAEHRTPLQRRERAGLRRTRRTSRLGTGSSLAFP
ncbi:hypothetical protein DFH07DRAFT_1064736, partial [Mycena maculata]